MTFIYALIRDNGDVFYIGKTCDVKRRMKEHKKKLGNPPRFKILEECTGDWRAAEHKWIEDYRSRGIRITNQTAGGNGCQEHSAATRAKISAIGMGRKVSDETKEKMRVGNLSVARNWSESGRIRIKSTQFKKDQDQLAKIDGAKMAAIIEKRRTSAKSLSSEERSRRNAKAWASYTPEQRAERGRNIAAGQSRAGIKRNHISPERRSEYFRNFWASMTPEARRQFIAAREAKRQATLAQKRA